MELSRNLSGIRLQRSGGVTQELLGFHGEALQAAIQLWRGLIHLSAMPMFGLIVVRLRGA